tara:strand:- start:104 stop:403 length:300 start_codon:yes stop_codon:yes gene_type:complete
MIIRWIYQTYEFARDGNADQVCRYINSNMITLLGRSGFPGETGRFLQEYRDRFFCGGIEDREFCQRVVKICAWFFTCLVWSNKNGPVICIETGCYYKYE